MVKYKCCTRPRGKLWSLACSLEIIQQYGVGCPYCWLFPN